MGSSILRGALAGGQLPTPLPPFSVVAGVTLAHVVLLRAGNGWINVLLGTAGMGWLLLDRRRRTGLTSAGSKEMFPQACTACALVITRRSKHALEALTHLDGRLAEVLARVSAARATAHDHHGLPDRLVAACYSQCRCGSRGIWFGSFNSLGRCSVAGAGSGAD